MRQFCADTYLLCCRWSLAKWHCQKTHWRNPTSCSNILLHAIRRWPGIISKDLWPYAINYAVNLHNTTIHCSVLAPSLTLFTGESPPWTFNSFCTFGCPIYVLDKNLQDGNNFKKWQERAWQGINVGLLCQHAGSVVWIYNPKSTHVTPQFHMVYDEGFSSVSHGNNADTTTKQKLNSILESLFDSSKWIYDDEYANNAEHYYFD